MHDARISTGLPGHPKTKKLLRRLGPSGPWALVCLFLWTAANRSDGDLSGMSDEDIELAADWQGDDGQLVQSLASVGFLDGAAGAYCIHDWAIHNPWAAGATDRSEASKWAALCKRYGRAGAAERMPDYAARMRPAPDPHAVGTKPQCDPDAPLPSPIPLPSPLPIQKQEQRGVTAAGLACKAMRQAGCPTANPAHPDLLAAIAEGVTAEALAETVREGLEAGKSKPFAWAISTARGRHAQGAKTVNGLSHGPTQKLSAFDAARAAFDDQLNSGAFDHDAIVVG